jgi:hypothetical protein
MGFRDGAARPALKPTPTPTLPLKGREFQIPSLGQGVASLRLHREGVTGPVGSPPGFPTTTLTATRNPAQADNGWTGMRHAPAVCVINRVFSK